MTVSGQKLDAALAASTTGEPPFSVRLAKLDFPIEFNFAGNRILAIRQDVWAEADQNYIATLHLQEHVAGRIFVRDEVYVLFSSIASGRSVPKRSVAQRLTQRELKVGCMIADGLTDKEIARKLGISAHTVREHCRRACAKLDISKRSALVRCLFVAGPPD
ncbi:helix-turn-helix transcriptional regulator [uncultured Jannaschia sp.]|uniref:helix-turn-helix transcriptional regulator n=1 Tax=uncultured Jannaschia sp. TaxID=293347 RepID=UPI003425792A